MPHYHCRKCHHEWEDYKARPCDWCEADRPIVLEEETPLENMLKNKDALLDTLKKIAKK